MKKKELDNAAERQLKEEARKLRREEKRRQKLLRMEEVFKKRLVLKMKAQQEKQKEINREKARLEITVKLRSNGFDGPSHCFPPLPKYVRSPIVVVIIVCR